MTNKDIENITKEWEEKTKFDKTTKATIIINVLMAIYFITKTIISKNPIYIICTILYLTLAMVIYQTKKIILIQDAIIDISIKQNNEQFEFIKEQQELLEEQDIIINSLKEKINGN